MLQHCIGCINRIGLRHLALGCILAMVEGMEADGKAAGAVWQAFEGHRGPFLDIWSPLGTVSERRINTAKYFQGNCCSATTSPQC
jgi:hypothetical protein